METKKGTNALLLIIAICLVLIVAKLYSGVDLVTPAEAQKETMTTVYACHAEGTAPCKWLPIRVDKEGYLVTKPIHIPAPN